MVLKPLEKNDFVVVLIQKGFIFLQSDPKRVKRPSSTYSSGSPCVCSYVCMYVCMYADTYRLGTVFGGLGYALNILALEGVSKFNLDIFNLVLLPIIIFESGFSLKKRGIFRNFKTITGFACVGTLFSALFTATCLASSLTSVSSIKEALLFGALISATDPVATLAVFKQVFKLGDREFLEAPLLYDLVFGESVLNDAVAIVLFQSFQAVDLDNFDGVGSGLT